MLADSTAHSFYMKEQKLLTPENYRTMIDNSKELQSADRVKGFINSYKAAPRYNEDPLNLEHEVRERISKQVKLPKKKEDEILRMKQNVIEESEQMRN